MADYAGPLSPGAAALQKVLETLWKAAAAYKPSDLHYGEMGCFDVEIDGVEIEVRLTIKATEAYARPFNSPRT
jgi:hypothetical protein